jgi:hypothetical protein
MLARPGPFTHPLPQGGVGGVEIGELLASQEAALCEVHAVFDFALVLGRKSTAPGQA